MSVRSGGILQSNITYLPDELQTSNFKHSSESDENAIFCHFSKYKNFVRCQILYVFQHKEFFPIPNFVYVFPTGKNFPISSSFRWKNNANKSMLKKNFGI